jgi:hypothetical protein
MNMDTVEAMYQAARRDPRAHRILGDALEEAGFWFPAQMARSGPERIHAAMLRRDAVARERGERVPHREYRPLRPGEGGSFPPGGHPDAGVDPLLSA